METQDQVPAKLKFFGGYFGVLLPFLVFLIGAVIIALSGAPDEKGFWPVLITALAVGLLLAKDRKRYSEVVIEGMSEKMVMVMIMAWILASTIGVLMTKTGLVDALIWFSYQLQLDPRGFVVASFFICCIISMSTGSSFATILICSPLLYPAGGMIGVHLPVLAGSILAGATFGDYSAPISDTTIASTLSQGAPIGPTVSSRLRVTIPIVIVCGIIFWLIQQFQGAGQELAAYASQGDARGIPMIIVPIVIIYLFLEGKHLLHGLMVGLFLGIAVGLATGLLAFTDIIALDVDNFRATSLIIDGINRAVGISFFTILLMGLVQTLKANGVVSDLVDYAKRKSVSKRNAENWIAGITSAAVLVTTHSIVAILMVKEFVSQTGQHAGVTDIRRANIMSAVVCFFPFVLPYFIPVILMSNMTQTGMEFGIAQLSPIDIGMYNLVAWGLLIWLILSIFIRKTSKT